MKRIIKFIFPEEIKKGLRKVENFILRIFFGFKNPIILKSKYHVRFILYPRQKTPIRWLVEEGAYAKEYEVMKKLVKNKDIVFDIGAHVGMITCYLAVNLVTSGRIYSFEPFPNSFEKLEENIAINHCKNVIVNQLAISNEIGTSNLYYEPENLQLNSLGKVSDGKKYLEKRMLVATNTIDNYCLNNNIQNINFLKIDTEGYEYNVLLGAERMLNDKLIHTIQFEVSKIPLESLGRNTNEIITYLKSKNYIVYEYLETTKTFREISSIMPGYDNYYASYTDLSRQIL